MKDRADIIDPTSQGRTRKRGMPKGKISWVIALTLVLVCVAYWLKCQFGLNFFNSISISSYFPFNLLENDVISAKEPGIIIDQNFDHPQISHQWANSIFHQNYRAQDQITDGGYGNHSRCLKITCDSKFRWSYPISKYISVRQGDFFRFEGLMYLEGDSEPARFCIAAFDKNKKIINWDLAVKGAKESGSWIKVQKSFAITDDRVRYITFRVTGAKGLYRLDNLLLLKLSRSWSDRDIKISAAQGSK